MRSVYEYKSCKETISITNESVTPLLYCMISTTKCLINFSTEVSHTFFIDSWPWIFCAVCVALLKSKQHALSLHKNTWQAHNTVQLAFKVTSTSDRLIDYLNVVKLFIFIWIIVQVITKTISSCGQKPICEIFNHY